MTEEGHRSHFKYFPNSLKHNMTHAGAFLSFVHSNKISSTILIHILQEKLYKIRGRSAKSN